MNNAKSASNEFLEGVQLKCNPSIMSFFKSNSTSLQSYSKTDDTTSTKVPIDDRTRATIHKDRGDLKYKPKLPVDNIKEGQNAKRIRPERFVSDSILPNRPFGDQYGFIPFFIKKAAEHLKLTKHRLPSKDSGVVPMVVEKAAVGITQEAAQQDQQSEGKYAADELLKVKDLGMKEVWKCCAHLYTKSTFLYTLINETMRWIGDEEHKSIWEDRIETLGPFCLLLWDNPFDKHMAKPETILYRGARLSTDYIAAFNKSWTKDSRALHSFQAFTSCTRDRRVAEIFADTGVLFVMRVKLAFTVDLKPYSQFPDEEEELLFPGACFRIDSLQFDKDAKRHLIHLTIHQKHDSKLS